MSRSRPCGFYWLPGRAARPTRCHTGPGSGHVETSPWRRLTVLRPAALLRFRAQTELGSCRRGGQPGSIVLLACWAIEKSTCSWGHLSPCPARLASPQPRSLLHGLWKTLWERTAGGARADRKSVVEGKGGE